MIGRKIQYLEESFNTFNKKHDEVITKNHDRVMSKADMGMKKMDDIMNKLTCFEKERSKPSALNLDRDPVGNEAVLIESNNVGNVTGSNKNDNKIVSKAEVENKKLDEIMKRINVLEEDPYVLHAPNVGSLTSSSCVNETLNADELISGKPVLNDISTTCDDILIQNRLKALEKSVNTLAIPLVQPLHTLSQNRMKFAEGNENGREDLPWTDVLRKRKKDKTPNMAERTSGEVSTSISKSRNWRQSLNLLTGTGLCENGNTSLSSDIDLVAYGVAKHVTALQLSKFVQDRGLDILDCVLLTKYDGARSLAFKVTIKAMDFEKSKNVDIWPYGVGVRRFKHFNENQVKQRDLPQPGGIIKKSLIMDL